MENFLLQCSFCNLRYLHVHVQVLLLTLFSAPQLLHRHEGCDCSKIVPGDGVDTQSQGFRMSLCTFTCHYTKTDKSQTETKMQRLESSKSRENLVLQTLGGTQPWFTNAGTCNPRLCPHVSPALQSGVLPRKRALTMLNSWMRRLISLEICCSGLIPTAVGWRSHLSSV